MTYIARNPFIYSDDSELYKLIIETANEGIWIIDENKHTVFLNQKMAKFLGHTIGEMLGKSIFDFIPKEHVDESRRMMAKWELSSSTQQVLQFISATGSDVWLSLNTSAIIKDGQQHGTLAMATNITEERMRLQELRQNRLNYTSLFEDLPVPIWDEDFSEIKAYIDQKKREGIRDFRKFFTENPRELEECSSLLIVNNINQAVVELNEAESKAQVLTQFRTLLTEKSAEYAIEQMVAIAENRSSCEFDAELRTFGNNIRYVHFRWTVVKGYEDSYKCVYLSTTDLTERIIDENLALQNSNREKAVLLKEIHHRVKNNLQIITSLLNLQSYGIEDPLMRSTFEMSLNRIKSMATVHEMLYRSNDFSGINYREYLSTLVSFLVESVKGEDNKMEIDMRVEDVVLNINTSIPLGLLINELITNSLKHGLRDSDSGEIYLHMTSLGGGNYSLKIGDNGIGIPAETDIFATETLGLQLVTSLVDQLSGSIELDRLTPGTHFKICFAELEAHQESPIS